MSSLISLCRLHRLIWITTLHTRIEPCYPEDEVCEGCVQKRVPPAVPGFQGHVLIGIKHADIATN
ncbi:hypothetical protein DPMN_040943 [Dreissena polymorpha]|uniref:Uncharacterized protein n=1 Tax=Dreissena polymorpha TaxID=45954 RepID=A0A9D4CXN1_DREPO|nr:hypothetical protein DPMN_040943 [Dreissena polymorpha]